MGSISDLLGSMATPAAKRAKPTIGEKLSGWAVRFRWLVLSWAQTPRLGSKAGGGTGGYAASKQASLGCHPPPLGPVRCSVCRQSLVSKNDHGRSPG